jgi:hypothetical protein
VNGSSQYQAKPVNALTSYVVTNITTSYSILSADQIISVGTTSGSINVTLLSSPSIGKSFTIKDSAGLAVNNNIIILGNGHNIDGSSSLTLSVNYQSVTVAYNGTGWMII